VVTTPSEEEWVAAPRRAALIPTPGLGTHPTREEEGGRTTDRAERRGLLVSPSPWRHKPIRPSLALAADAWKAEASEVEAQWCSLPALEVVATLNMHIEGHISGGWQRRPKPDQPEEETLDVGNMPS
jgi:hypothetical protein